MTDLRKAAEMALEFVVLSSSKDRAWFTEKEFEVVAALRQALAQPEQKPYGYFGYDFRLDAWIKNPDDIRGTPFYTAPPKREWVGLTDEEIYEIVGKKWWDWEDAFDIEGFSRAIEARLKEKNT